MKRIIICVPAEKASLSFLNYHFPIEFGCFYNFKFQNKIINKTFISKKLKQVLSKCINHFL